VALPNLWKVVIEGLANVWPADESRESISGKQLGDVWVASNLLPEGTTPESVTDEQKLEALVPFHKLSQWLCYSLVEV
jgi:hypothetical protein